VKVLSDFQRSGGMGQEVLHDPADSDVAAANRPGLPVLLPELVELRAAFGFGWGADLTPPPLPSLRVMPDVEDTNPAAAGGVVEHAAVAAAAPLAAHLPSPHSSEY
jgi:hypothetical protein